MKRWLLMLALTFAATEVMHAAQPAVAEAAKRRRRRKTRLPPPAAADAPAPGSFRGPTRMDFDDRLVQGQTNKSGAVVLFSRKATNISSMVKRRKSFRHLTLETIYDR
jgi:hypothetical protein